MYIIYNKTTNINTSHHGDFPTQLTEEMLNRGDRVAVVSLYSNTIKVPYCEEYYGEKVWEWESFPLPQGE